LRRLCPPDEPKRDADWRAVWLAGEALPALRRVTIADTRDADLDERIVNRLSALLTLGSLPAPDRAAAGRALSALGDPRPGVGVSPLPSSATLSSATREGRAVGAGLPDILWSNIPSGTLLMGARRGETFQTPRGQEEPYDDEFWPDGQPRAIQIKSFKLAAYPITVAQFRPFVQDPDGWAKPGWWTEVGLQDRGEHNAPYYWDDPQWHIDNHPVVGVTWYAAVAYCRWLTARLRASGDPQFANALIRLPTEAEWEWTARGPAPIPNPSPVGKRQGKGAAASPLPKTGGTEGGRRWPWGNDWRADACNSSEAHIGRTSAVGMFLPTSSPVEDGGGAGWGPVYDLAGNVWEWCSTRWQSYDDKYPAIKGVDEWTNKYLHGDASRVLRGGAFYAEARDVRGAFRGGHPPRYGGPLRGFRCVCASGSSSGS
jgi:formylglycine-generating enzyme required for sulfatase activity